MECMEGRIPNSQSHCVKILPDTSTILPQFEIISPSHISFSCLIFRDPKCSDTPSDHRTLLGLLSNYTSRCCLDESGRFRTWTQRNPMSHRKSDLPGNPPPRMKKRPYLCLSPRSPTLKSPGCGPHFHSNSQRKAKRILRAIRQRGMRVRNN